MVIEELVSRFPQLYVAPADDAEDAYKAAAARGIAPADKSLSHFEGDERDWLRAEETPAGPVDALFLAKRKDFETFLQCILHRARPDEIPASVGAMTIGNLPDWGKINAHRLEYLQAGGDDWGQELKRFVSDPSNYRVTFVVISEGPNSAVPADQTPYDEQAWLDVSRELRLYHELAHVVCRRLLPGDVAPVWDEITADMHGLLRATGHYDAKLALRLLGIVDATYIGGRLEEYLSDEQKAQVPQITADVVRACEGVAERTADFADPATSYDVLLDLKRNPLIDY